VVAGIILANLLTLAGVVDVDPLGSVGQVGGVVQQGFLPGIWFADPNIGYTAQALGHLAAMDWLHGIVPWWNPYEGLGAPLAAEMQSAAFFPPTLLLALPNGQLLFHVLLEVAAGLATFFLARELGCRRSVATLAGLLFALNGTFAWWGSASVNTLAFLPLAILGVERIWRRRAPDPAGWLLLALSLALSVYAGFPEIAYLDGLFVVVWSLFRLAGHPAAGRARFAGRVLLGGGTGLLLAAPLLVAFAGYLPIADVGGHTGGFGLAVVPRTSLSLVGLPYLYGPLNAFNGLAHGISYGGGFATIALLAAATVGVLGGHLERRLRILLAAVTVLLVLWEYGVPPFAFVLRHVVPYAGHLADSSYTQPVWELALVLLAASGVEALAAGRLARWAVAAGGLLGLAMVGLDLALAWPAVQALEHRAAGYHGWPVASVAWGAGTAVVLALVAIFLRGKRRLAAALVGSVLALDALTMFVTPQLSAPRTVALDLAPADYLATHLGTARFYSVGPYQPDYGSYFGLASLDVNDLPAPTLWERYVSRLSPNADPLIFNGGRVVGGTPSRATQAQTLVQRLAAYEAAGVRYVLTRPGADPFAGSAGAGDGVQLVASSPYVSIYELPHPRPYFSATGGRCTLAWSSREAVAARCGGPASLLRLELDLPGWTATVDGHSVPIRSADGGFMSVPVPAGNSTVTFAYLPPHEDLGLAAGVAGFLLAVGWPVLCCRRRRAQPAAPAPAETAPAAPSA
jgi:hypothetical protein